MLSLLSPEHIQILLSSLQQSYNMALSFDGRPGLKFLMQKVAQLQRAANLYRQAGAAWTIKVTCLIFLPSKNLTIHFPDGDFVRTEHPRIIRARRQIDEAEGDDGMHERWRNQQVLVCVDVAAELQ
jgi:hypothetical protein